VVAAVKEGRITFQRILTYTLNSVTKKVVQVLFLVTGLLVTGHAILTPRLMVIIMIIGDFLGMALTTDNVVPSQTPSAWRVGRLTVAGVAMGLCELLYCGGVLAAGKYLLGLGVEGLQTLAFVAIVFGNQATTYTNRTRARLWSVRPSAWLVRSSLADLAIASVLANVGIGMTPLPALVIGAALAGAVLLAFMADLVKVPLFRRVGIS
jgi:H+-transporting ATPase